MASRMNPLRLPLLVAVFSALACGGIAEPPADEGPAGGSSGQDASTGGSVGRTPLLPVEPEPEPECAESSGHSRECRPLSKWSPPEEHCFTLEELSERCNLARSIEPARGGLGGAPQAETSPGALGGAAGSTGLACPHPDDLEWGTIGRGIGTRFYHGVCDSTPEERNGECCYEASYEVLTI